ncbi:unnamed protein product, partial [Porites lobata]
MSLNLFDVPDVDYRYEAKRYVPFKPANTGKRPILFTVPSSEDYYDLNAWAASTANLTKYVYCVNNFGHTLFNQMNVHFNGVLMSEQSNAYHQKAYIETLLNYNREEGRTILAPQGWVNEVQVKEELVPTNANNDDQPDTANWDGKTGLKTLTNRLLGKVHLFLFGTPDTTTSVNKKIPTLADDDIFVTLHMLKVTLNASVYTRLQKERALSKTKRVKYPVVRSEIRTFSFDGKSTRWEQDNFFVGRVPDRVVLGLVKSKNYNGDLTCYPFAYEKFGVTRVRQSVDGEEYPYRSLEMAGNTQAEDLLGYNRFLTPIGAHKQHKPTMILPSDWGQGKNCTLYVFNNVPGDADDPHYRNPRQTGNVRYEIDFQAAVDHNITVVIWSEYENLYEIDQQGFVIYYYKCILNDGVKSSNSRPFGYFMLDLHPASDDRFRIWSHLTKREGRPQVHTF